MEVKCPKCRLRFDVAVPHGFTEVQCNCPRCGTPFTYKTEGKEEAEDLKPKGNGDTGSGSDVAGTETEAQEPQDIDITTDDAKPQETKDGAFRDVYMQHIFDSRGPLVIKEEYRRQSKRKAYMLVLGIMAMIVLVGLFAKGVDMFVSHFTDNDMARSEQLAADSTLGPAGGSATGSKTDSKESRGRHGRGKSHEALPRGFRANGMRTMPTDIY